MLHLKINEVKQNCKKMRQTKIFLKNDEKRRFIVRNGRNREKTGGSLL